MAVLLRFIVYEGEHSAILLTFIKLPFVIKTFVLSIFECPFYTVFTVYELLIFMDPVGYFIININSSC